jgi:transketolase
MRFNEFKSKIKDLSMKPLELKTKLHTSPAKPTYTQTIKSKNGEEVVCADPNVTRALVAIMDLHAVNGGAASHWGGPAAIAEVMSSLHTIMFKEKNWFEHYNFVNDIGHAENGVYALRANWGFGGMKIQDLWGFRGMHSNLTGHGESHLYPEGVLLSNGPLSSAVPQAQGLALADKITGNKRVTVCSMSDGAAMEGEAKEAFAAIPGFAAKGKLNPFVLIISDNNTKLSGRIDGDSFSMAPTFKSLETLGWETLYIEKGNDLEATYQALEDGLEKARTNPNKPVALVFKTVKGYGVKKTEEANSGGHGFPVKAYSEDIVGFVEEIFGGSAPAEFVDWAKECTNKPETSGGSSTPKEKMQAGLSRGAIKACKDGYPVFSISSDLQGSTGMAGFQKEYPDNYLDVGIAESNMVSVGAGFSKMGYVPIVDTFAAFGITKGNLPLIMASLSQSPMIAVFSHTGFQDAADGASHQSTTYLAALSAIPHVHVHVISSAQEGEELMYKAIKSIADERKAGRDGESHIFFVGRENYPTEIKSGLTYNLGGTQVIESGKDVTIAAVGPVLYKAIKAAEILKGEGITATVLNQSSINKINTSTVISEVKATGGNLVTVEDHQTICGMGSQLIHAIHQGGYHELKSKSLGVPGTFGQSAYKADHLYEKYGLDEKGIVKAVKELLGK